MSIYYSAAQLNTFWGTPYFQAHIPKNYPIYLICQKARAFRRLPPNVKELSKFARHWVMRKQGVSGVEGLYDSNGFELNPGTGQALTDQEIDAQWHDDPSLSNLKVTDIPRPEGGFPDPNTWEPGQPTEEEEEYEGPDEKKLLSDIKSHGREYTARYYNVPADQLAHVKSDEDLARMILGMHNRSRPAAVAPVQPAALSPASPNPEGTAAL
jgi:hypothetical protein